MYFLSPRREAFPIIMLWEQTGVNVNGKELWENDTPLELYSILIYTVAVELWSCFVVFFLLFFNTVPHVLMALFFSLIHEERATQPQLPYEPHLFFIGGPHISSRSQDPAGAVFSSTFS